MIRELHITDDRGVEHPVHADDLLVGEPWNAARSASEPSRRPPAIYRTWTQRLGVGVSHLIGLFVLTGLLRRSLNLHFAAALILVGLTYTAIYLAHRRYGADIHSIFWRRRLRKRVAPRAAHQHARLSIARDRICPCCAYGLADAPREADGCTLCPECGAAWQVDTWSSDAGIYRPPAITPAGKGHEWSPVNAADARGVIVPLLARRISSDRRHAILTLPSRPSRVRLRVALLAWTLQLVVTGGVAWFAIAVIKPDGLLEWLGTTTVVFMVAAMIGVAVIHAYMHQLAMATHAFLIREVVAAGRCPCCESSLRPTPSVIDGSRLCDTCGCAWESTDPPDAFGPP